jgi:hypothetical protein
VTLCPKRPSEPDRGVAMPLITAQSEARQVAKKR